MSVHNPNESSRHRDNGGSMGPKDSHLFSLSWNILFIVQALKRLRNRRGGEEGFLPGSSQPYDPRDSQNPWADRGYGETDD